MVSKKIIWFIMFYVLTTFIYSQTVSWNNNFRVSGLVQYPAKNTQLELLEENIQIILTRERLSENLFYSYGDQMRNTYTMQNTYIVKNKGERTNAKLGVLCSIEDGLSVIPNNMEIIVQESIANFESITYKPETMENKHIRTGITNWIVTEIDFPADSEIKIVIRYSNPLDYDSHNEFVLYDTVVNTGRFSLDGQPVFNVNITNDSGKDISVESQWISDIRFYHNGGDSQEYSNRTSYSLQNQDSLKNELFAIKKKTANSWEINFTNQFTENYTRSFLIYIKYWSGYEAFCKMGITDPNMYLGILKSEKEANISKRELGTYELIFLTNKQLQIMRNAIYAQYGYIFKNEDIRKVFMADVYDGFLYRENQNFSENMLTDIDRANIETIRWLERMVQ